MVNFNLKNAENLLAAKASTQPLNDFPVDQLPLGLRDSLSGVAPEARVPALFDASRERGDGASRETIRKMISRWTKRGLCKKLKSGDTEIWQKLTLSA